MIAETKFRYENILVLHGEVSCKLERITELKGGSNFCWINPQNGEVDGLACKCDGSDSCLRQMEL